MTEKRDHLTSRETLVSRHLTPERGNWIFTPLYLFGAIWEKPQKPIAISDGDVQHGVSIDHPEIRTVCRK